jgi:hypothetical protein
MDGGTAARAGFASGLMATYPAPIGYINIAMIETLLLLHLTGFGLALGGMTAQLVLFGRFHKDEGVVPERLAAAVIRIVQVPGFYLAVASGIALVAVSGWELLERGWLQFKLLFVVWIWLASRLMLRSTRQIEVLRRQCGSGQDGRIGAVKGNHLMTVCITGCVFVFILVFSIWKPF